MVCQEIETYVEESDPEDDPSELTDAERLARLKMELRQARRQITEMQHLLKYRAMVSPPSLELAEFYESLQPHMLELPPMPSRRALRQMRAKQRRIALSIASFGLLAILILGALESKSSGSLTQSQTPLSLTTAQITPSLQTALQPVAIEPIIAPAENLAQADSPQLAQVPLHTEVKPISDALVSRPHRHHRIHHAVQTAVLKETPSPNTPDIQTPNPQPAIDTKDGWLE